MVLMKKGEVALADTALGIHFSYCTAEYRGIQN